MYGCIGQTYQNTLLNMTITYCNILFYKTDIPQCIVIQDKTNILFCFREQTYHNVLSHITYLPLCVLILDRPTSYHQILVNTPDLQNLFAYKRDLLFNLKDLHNVHKYKSFHKSQFFFFVEIASLIYCNIRPTYIKRKVCQTYANVRVISFKVK